MSPLGLADTDLLDQLFDSVYVHDMEGKIVFWNRAAENLTGFSRGEVLGRSCSDNILNHVDESGEGLCLNRCPMAATRADGVRREAEVFLHHKDGHRIPVIVRAGPLRGHNGKILGSIEIFSDNSMARLSRERIGQLEKLAMWDELTQLPNRRYAETILHSKLGEFERVGLPFGVLMADIDFFKRVNDTFGHNAGDDVLRVVSKTMDAVKRPYDFVARWGGEEFLSIVSASDPEVLRSVAERFIKQVANSETRTAGEALSVTISVGGAFCEEGDDPKSLIGKADRMLYRSKAEGRDRVTLLGPTP